MQFAVRLQAFDGGDLFAFDLLHADEAGADGFAIQQHSAGAALPFTAAVFGAGEAEFFSQCVQQRPVGSAAQIVADVVDEEFHALKSIPFDSLCDGARLASKGWLSKVLKTQMDVTLYLFLQLVYP